MMSEPECIATTDSEDETPGGPCDSTVLGVSINSGSSSAEETSTSTSTSSSTVSLLDRLRSPLPSELSRKRKVHTNPPPKGKRRSASRGYCDPKSVSPLQRVREFPGEELTVSACKLFCRACRGCLGLKRSVILSHMKSAKHDEGKKRLLQKEAKELDIATAMKKHDEETHRKGETLPCRGAACLSGPSGDCFFASRSSSV